MGPLEHLTGFRRHLRVTLFLLKSTHISGRVVQLRRRRLRDQTMGALVQGIFGLEARPAVKSWSRLVPIGGPPTLRPKARNGG